MSAASGTCCPAGPPRGPGRPRGLAQELLARGGGPSPPLLPHASTPTPGTELLRARPTRRSVRASLPATVACTQGRPRRVPSFGPDARAQLFDQRVVRRRHRAVARFQRGAVVQQQRQVARHRHLVPCRSGTGGSPRRRCRRLPQVGHHLERVLPQGLDLAVRLLGHAVGAEVHFDRPPAPRGRVRRRGRPAGNLLADDEVRRVGWRSRTRGSRRCCRGR